MHFLTIVIGEDFDGQLEPYQENNLGTCPEQYLEFYDVEDDYREHYATGIFDDPADKERHPERYLKFVREVFPTFDDYMDAEYGPRDERTGRYGDWWNPNSEYDWFQVGGRWTGHLILKPGRPGLLGTPGVRTPPAGPGRADQARIGDVDFAAMAREDFGHLMAAWEELERQGKSLDRVAKERELVPATLTTRAQFEAYARRRSRHCAPAAVVHQGEWFGPWWVKGYLTEAAADGWDAWYSALLASLPDDTVLTVVDCHV